MAGCSAARAPGHLLALDRHTTGDGIVSALLVLQAAGRSGRTLAELLAGVDLFPQTLINVPVRPGAAWKTAPRLSAELAAVTSELGSEGRVLIRESGTEPVVRVMVEARDGADTGPGAAFGGRVELSRRFREFGFSAAADRCEGTGWPGLRFRNA